MMIMHDVKTKCYTCYTCYPLQSVNVRTGLLLVFEKIWSNDAARPKVDQTIIRPGCMVGGKFWSKKCVKYSILYTMSSISIDGCSRTFWETGEGMFPVERTRLIREHSTSFNKPASRTPLQLNQRWTSFLLNFPPSFIHFIRIFAWEIYFQYLWCSSEKRPIL